MSGVKYLIGMCNFLNENPIMKKVNSEVFKLLKLFLVIPSSTIKKVRFAIFLFFFLKHHVLNMAFLRLFNSHLGFRFARPFSSSTVISQAISNPNSNPNEKQERVRRSIFYGFVFSSFFFCFFF